MKDSPLREARQSWLRRTRPAIGLRFASRSRQLRHVRERVTCSTLAVVPRDLHRAGVFAYPPWVQQLVRWPALDARARTSVYLALEEAGLGLSLPHYHAESDLAVRDVCRRVGAALATELPARSFDGQLERVRIARRALPMDAAPSLDMVLDEALVLRWWDDQLGTRVRAKAQGAVADCLAGPEPDAALEAAWHGAWATVSGSETASGIAASGVLDRLVVLAEVMDTMAVRRAASSPVASSPARGEFSDRCDAARSRHAAGLPGVARTAYVEAAGWSVREPTTALPAIDSPAFEQMAAFHAEYGRLPVLGAHRSADELEAARTLARVRRQWAHLNAEEREAFLGLGLRRPKAPRLQRRLGASALTLRFAGDVQPRRGVEAVIRRVEAFVRSHGHVPSRSDDAGLYQAVLRCRRDWPRLPAALQARFAAIGVQPNDQRRLVPEERAARRAGVPSHVAAVVDAIEGFVAQTGRLPRYDAADPAERRLYYLEAGCRRGFLALPPSMQRRLDAAGSHAGRVRDGQEASNRRANLDAAASADALTRTPLSESGHGYESLDLVFAPAQERAR